MDHQIKLAIIANTVFGLSVIAAASRPLIARMFLTVSFIGSAVFNFYKLSNLAALASNEEMSVLPLFRNYVLGFSEHLVFSVVLTIAIIQLVIAIGLIVHKRWTIAAMLIGACYGLFISSLGGYEFPAALLMSIAFIIMAGKYKHDYLWRLNQYSTREQASFRHQSFAG